jgi:hypothetical protein
VGGGRTARAFQGTRLTNADIDALERIAPEGAIQGERCSSEAPKHLDGER